MLKQLRLKNFKQHRGLTVNFERGLNAIQGENAQGKTTILKAILFALQGVTGAGNKDHLTTRGETGMRVELDWDLGADGNFMIVRTLNIAQVWKDGELLASGQTPVTKWAEEKLGMASKLFKSLLYAEQGKTQKLLDDGPTDLQKQLEAVAQCDVIDTIMGMIKTDNTHADGEISGIGVVPDVKAFKQQLEADQDVFRDLSGQLARWDEELHKTEHALAEVKTAYEQGLEAVMDSKQLQIERGRLEGERNALTTQRIQLEVGEVESVDAAALDELAESTASLDASATAQQRALDRLEDEHKAYNALLERTEALNQWRQVITGWEQLEEAIGLAKDAADLARAGLEKKEAEVKNAVCSSCKRPFHEADMSALALAAAEAKDRLEVAENELTDARAALESFVSAHNTTAQKLNATRSTLRDLDTQLASRTVPEPIDPNAQEAIWGIQEEAKAQKERLLDLRGQLRAYNEWSNRYASVKNSLDHVEQRLEGVLSKLGGLSLPTDEELGELKMHVDSFTTVLNTAKSKRLECSQRYSETERNIKSLESQIADSEVKADRIARLKHQIAERLELQKFLRNNRSRLMEEAWTALTNYTSHLVSSVTDGYISDLTRNESGGFFAVEGGHPTPVEELSGAQKSIIGLCLRLSLSHLFYGDNGFVLLDEVTADCSETNASRVAGMLRGLNQQALMVTHRQGDALNASNVILLS